MTVIFIIIRFLDSWSRPEDVDSRSDKEKTTLRTLEFRMHLMSHGRKNRDKYGDQNMSFIQNGGPKIIMFFFSKRPLRLKMI